MKEKQYYSQFAYYIKSILIIVTTIIAYISFTMISEEIALSLSKYFRMNLIAIEYTINGFVILFSILIILLIILRNKPKIVLNDTYIRTNRFKKEFTEIKTYNPARGGSEPFFITHDNKQYDLELSWFSKSDREEIEKIILTKIAANA